MKLATALIVATLSATAASAGGLGGLDLNNDGGVSKAEFLHVYGPDRGVETFRHADSDRNGIIDGAESRAETSGSGIFSNLMSIGFR